MRSWLLLLGGPIVWAVHFFALYGIAEFAPHVGLVLAVTVPCFAGQLLLLRHAVRLPGDEPFTRWRRSVAVGGVALGLVAVTWQALPALVR